MATPTLAGSCSYPPGRRLLQTDSLQGSGYYICRCICAPRAGQPQERCWLSRVPNRLAAARVQLSRKCCRYDSRFALGCEAVQPVLSRGNCCAAQTVRLRSAGNDKKLVGTWKTPAHTLLLSKVILAVSCKQQAFAQ